MIEPSAEIPKTDATILDLSQPKEGRFLPENIKVDGKFIGASLWKQMLDVTNMTQKEHDITVSKIGSRILTSKIHQGSGEWTDPQTGQQFPPATRSPGMPHGILSLLATNITQIHTHPDEADSSRRPLNRIGRSDISAYLHNSFNALVMLNRDGVHMLVGKNPLQGLKPEEIAKEAHENVDEESDSDEEIRAKVAKTLLRYGVAYYYSPDKETSPEGSVRFSIPKIAT